MIHQIFFSAFLGTFIEGEMTLSFISLYCQSQGYSYGYLVLASWMGSILWDQGLFFLIRCLFMKHSWLLELEQVKFYTTMRNFLEKDMNFFIFSFRFIPGLRSIGPILLARSTVTNGDYVRLNLLSSLIWVVSISGTMFYMGQHFGHYALIFLGAFISLLLLLKIILFIYQK